MKFTALFLIFAIVAVSVLGQTKKPAAKSQQKPAPAKAAPKKPSTAIAKKSTPVKVKSVPTPKPLDENAEFEAASSAEPLERVNALKKFIVSFPNSERTPKAKELLVVARATVADDKLRSGDTETAISLFKLAVDEAPEPIPDKLFADVISKFPYNLYFGGQKPDALAIASKIESRVSANAAQLVALARFHASIENGADTIRVAEVAANLDPNSSPAYQAIGLGHRLNFELDKSAAAYSKALELDPDSLNSKQSLAEMNRALGKPDEAAKLYREMLAVAEGDVPAQTGLILALFDAGKKAEAEAEMAKSLEANPNNVTLIAGAAYWYSANGDPDKAIELGEKATVLEPRYVWAHIALARGLAGKQKAVDAERVLIKARSYGNFPTVEFELATARLAAGFYREAVEDLQKSFALKDGNIVAKLGGRTERTGAGFEELLAAERKASIFAPSSGSAGTDQKLKQLLELQEKVNATEPDIASIATTVDEFTSGTDSMKVHRQLYAASLLLQRNVALDKVVEVARSATGNTDSALDSPNAGSAVMASELYDSRSLAFSRNEFLLVPEVPRQTLSVILRGRVEDIAGWALYQQSKYPDAVVRLRRAISVLPNPSAWWRASMWRLGAALAADGKEKEALDSYVASYSTDKPDLAKYSVVESMYKRVNNGSTDGLEALIGKERVVTIAGNLGPPTAPVAEIKTEDKGTPLEPAPTAAEVAPPIRIPRGVPIDRSSIAPKAEAVSSPPAGESVEPKLEQAPTVNGLTNDPQVLKEIEKPKPEPEPSPSGTLDSAKAQSSQAPGGLTSDPQASKELEKSKPEPATTISGTPALQTKAEQSAGVGSPATESENRKLEEAATPKSEPPPTRVLGNDPEKANPDAAAPPKVEPSPTPSESILEAKPSETIEKPKEEVQQEETKAGGSEIVKPVDPKPDAQPKIKPLFEPIIITIPNAKSPLVKPHGESSAGAARPRIVEGAEIKAEEIPVCKIDVSQENISLINNGGTIGLIVTVDDEAAPKQLMAVSSSPSDIEISPEAGSAEPSKQRLYIIKSISTTPGVYQVRFAAVCGKRDVIVTVR